MNIPINKGTTTTIESDEQKLFDTLYKCERDLSHWIQQRLAQVASLNVVGDDLSVMLSDCEYYLKHDIQLLQPIKSWNQQKEACYNMSVKTGKSIKLSSREKELLRKTAFDGQVLLLTIYQ